MLSEVVSDTNGEHGGRESVLREAKPSLVVEIATHIEVGKDLIVEPGTDSRQVVGEISGGNTIGGEVEDASTVHDPAVGNPFIFVGTVVASADLVALFVVFGGAIVDEAKISLDTEVGLEVVGEVGSTAANPVGQVIGVGVGITDADLKVSAARGGW